VTLFERWSVWSTAIATGITGLGFMWAKYFVNPPGPWAVVNHPLEPWLLKAHIVVAPAFVFAVGLVTARHIIPHLLKRERPGRRSGLTMVWTLLPMVLSGYLIQVVSMPGWLVPLAVVHIVTGFGFLLALVGHRVRSKSEGRRVERALSNDARRPTIQNQTRHEALRCRVSVLVRNTHSTELER